LLCGTPEQRFRSSMVSINDDDDDDDNDDDGYFEKNTATI